MVLIFIPAYLIDLLQFIILILDIKTLYNFLLPHQAIDLMLEIVGMLFVEVGELLYSFLDRQDDTLYRVMSVLR